MILVQRKDGVAVYLFAAGAEVVLGEAGLEGPEVRAIDITSQNAVLIEDVPEPDCWAGGALSWDGQAWAVVDQDLLDRELERQRQLQYARLAAIRADKSKQMLFNGRWVTTTQEDQSNVSNALQLLKALAARGVPDPTIEFEVVRGVFTTMSVAALEDYGVAVGMYVQFCWGRAKALRDLIAASPAPARVDLATGWMW